jgi:chemotaxis response regulator CheB
LTIDRTLHAHLLEDHFYKVHCIDALFTSLAQHAGPRTIAVVLSGLLKDGAAGLNAIKQAGGRAFVQDPKDALYEDMPRAAMHYCNSNDVVAPIPELAVAIRDCIKTVASHNSD